MHTNTQHHSARHTQILQWGVFAAGVAAMAVAGFILIEGMLKFGGDTAARNIFIAAGIIFQISETICFVACALMTRKSLRWRIGLFTLGTLLFAFSIAVMTLAQKATLFSGEQRNDAIELQIQALNSQIESLSHMISSYQFNAEKQSKSIYADSRKRGQDSLNRATKLEEKKLDLMEQLFVLNQTKQHTSSQFFKQIELVTGLPALETEFYFLVIRSLLLELCGIVLMAFSAYLIGSIRIESQAEVIPAKPKSRKENPNTVAMKLPTKSKKDSSWAAKYINALRETHQSDDAEIDGIDSEQAELLALVIELYRSGKINNLEIEGIISVLNKQLSKNIQPSTAQVIQRLAKKRLNID